MRVVCPEAIKLIRECKPYMTGDNWLETVPPEVRAKYEKACAMFNEAYDKEEKEMYGHLYNDFRINSKVKTRIEKEGYPIGTTGVLISLSDISIAGEVELLDETGQPFDIVSYKLYELELIRKKKSDKIISAKG